MWWKYRVFKDKCTIVLDRRKALFQLCHMSMSKRSEVSKSSRETNDSSWGRLMVSFQLWITVIVTNCLLQQMFIQLCCNSLWRYDKFDDVIDSITRSWTVFFMSPNSKSRRKAIMSCIVFTKLEKAK